MDTSTTSPPHKDHSKSSNSIIGALSAAGRTMTYRLTTFYLRTPLKLFRPPRFDYLHYIRASLANDPALSGAKFYQRSSIHLLNHALNKYGWRIIPEKVLPPLILNSITGVVLYTTYLQTRWTLNRDVEGGTPAYYHNIYKAGLIAGAAQALVSTPVDAIFARQTTDELVSQMSQHRNLWRYGWDKWRQIGVRGCYGGFALALPKESLGFATYFWAFEYIKDKYREDVHDSKYVNRAIIFVSGVTSAILLQLIQYPMGRVEKVHQQRLEALDLTHKPYNHAYRETWAHLYRIHRGSTLPGSKRCPLLLSRWLYRGFLRNTLAVIPGTTAGLLFLNYLRAQTEARDAAVLH